MMDSAALAMEMAEEALASLLEVRAGPDKFALHTARRQYRYAVICAIFSAMVVEGCLRRLIAGRIWFQSRNPERDVLRAAWAGHSNIHRVLAFIRVATDFDPALLKDIEELMTKRRNRIVHGGSVDMTEEVKADDDGKPVTWRGLSSVNLSEEDIENAEWCVGVAKRTQDAVRQALRDPRWKPFEP